MNILVSIVVPVYNMGLSIERCVNSIRQQDYKNIEIILVDDGSKDDSLARCKELSIKDNRISVYHTENNGSGPARNYGIEHSKGEYIYFPDADDYLKQTAVSSMVEATDNGRYDIVVFGFRSINSKGEEVFKKAFSDYMVTGENARNDYSDYMGHTTKYAIQGAPWNKFFSSSVIKENKVRYPHLRRHQDEGFIGRYMCYAKNIHFISDILYTHYVNDLKMEWDKFPVNYMDSVIGLYQLRKETILGWNPNDKKTKDMVDREYICNFIKACELTFSPKMKLDYISRRKKIMQYIDRSNVLCVSVPDIIGWYQKFILVKLRNRNYALAVMVMRIKIMAERIGLLGRLR